MEILLNIQIEPLSPEESNNFVKEIIRMLPEKWRLLSPKEKIYSIRSEKSHEFFYPGSNDLGMGLVVISFREVCENYAIVSLSCKEHSGRLEVAFEEEEITRKLLKYFHSNVIVPVAKKLGVSFTEEYDEWEISEVISSESHEKLNLFLSHSNKSNKIKDEKTLEYWNDFLISLVLNDENLTQFEFRQWLIEDENWDKDNAHELSAEFSRSIKLLEQYKNKLRN